MLYHILQINGHKVCYSNFIVSWTTNISLCTIYPDTHGIYS